MGGCGCSGSFRYAIAGAVVIESVRAASVSVVFSIAVPRSVLEVRIEDCTSSTLLGTAIKKTTLTEAARTDSITTAPAMA